MPPLAANSKFSGASLVLGPKLRGLLGPKLRSWDTSRFEALSRVPLLVAKRHQWDDLKRNRFIYSAAAQPGETLTLHRHRLHRPNESSHRRQFSAMASATNFFEFKALDCKLLHMQPLYSPHSSLAPSAPTCAYLHVGAIC